MELANMDVGIGLPSGIPGATATEVLDWARRAEARRFASVAAWDRMVFGNWEPLIALAGAAGVTRRVRLVTTVLNIPYRGNSALLAKQAATIQVLSDGRLVLGVGIGPRIDDFTASGTSHHGRGAAMDAALDDLTRIWEGEPRGYAGAIGPRPTPPPALLIGGFSDASFRRVARYGSGWIGAGAPDFFALNAEKVRAAWRQAQRPGEPRLVTAAFFALGDHAQEAASRFLLDMYSYLDKSNILLAGDLLSHLSAQNLADAALTTVEAVRGAQRAFASVGCSELILLPASTDPGQVDLLADALA